VALNSCGVALTAAALSLLIFRVPGGILLRLHGRAPVFLFYRRHSHLWVRRGVLRLLGEATRPRRLARRRRQGHAVVFHLASCLWLLWEGPCLWNRDVSVWYGLVLIILLYCLNPFILCLCVCARGVVVLTSIPMIVWHLHQVNTEQVHLLCINIYTMCVCARGAVQVFVPLLLWWGFGLDCLL
jgi:hypothetical protein